ncbi:hypothetical protein C0993_012357 [Termitomyces sp. T159_Od127]|nr:hypothetical protein C0993_012357 [Termitomyces sp. T159_Od127]
MESGIAKQLIDKIYEKRKAAALDLEKQIRECHQAGDQRRINQIIDQLVEMFSNNTNPLHIRNGGLIGLAGTAIALGVDIAPYMEKFIDPVLDCFDDPENRIRYFSAECLYNIAHPGRKKAFSLAHFIPLLRERIYVISPFTRSYLVSWINVLDSVPELELISYLPEFFDGLLKYLSDPTEDVRVATETILADFLREIRDVCIVRRQLDEQAKGQTPSESLRHVDIGEKEKLPELTLETSEKAVFINDNEQASFDCESLLKDDNASANVDDRNIGGALRYVFLLYGHDDEIQQSTALRWLAEFLVFTPDVMVPFTPRFVPAILPNLALHVPMIQHAAVRTNKLLFGVIQNLPSPVEVPRPSTTEKPTPRMMRSPTPSAANSKQSTVSSQEVASPGDSPIVPTAPLQRQRASVDMSLTPRAPDIIPSALPQTSGPSRPHSPLSFTSQNASNHMAASNTLSNPEEADLFDYQATVNELTIQFLSEFEETRVAALKWLIMLHQKAPKKAFD